MYNLTVTEFDEKVYREELRDFLPDEFIDIHAHLWRSDFTPYGAANGGSAWSRMVADELTGEQLTDTYRRLFPGKKVTPLVFGGVDQDIRQVNDFTASESAKYGFPKLFRSDYIMSKDELEQSVKEGGFLGLKPYITNCPPYIPAPEIRIFDYLTPEHLEVADKNGWIVMLHIPRSLRLRDAVNVGQLMEIEKKYPNVKLIVAHVGRAYSKQDLGDAFETLKNTEHMLFDFTANLCDDAIRACIEAVGTKRLMFGADLPIAIMRMYRIVDEKGFYINVVPRGMYGDVSKDPHMKESDEKNISLMIYESLRAFRRVALDMKLSDTAVEDIMFNNSRKLIDSVR